VCVCTRIEFISFIFILLMGGTYGHTVSKNSWSIMIRYWDKDVVSMRGIGMCAPLFLMAHYLSNLLRHESVSWGSKKLKS